MEKNPPMVYDHKHETFHGAINVSPEELKLLGEKIKPIIASFSCKTIQMSEMTELLEMSLTQKELLFIATLYAKNVAIEAIENYGRFKGFGS